MALKHQLVCTWLLASRNGCETQERSRFDDEKISEVIYAGGRALTFYRRLCRLYHAPRTAACRCTTEKEAKSLNFQDSVRVSRAILFRQILMRSPVMKIILLFLHPRIFMKPSVINQSFCTFSSKISGHDSCSYLVKFCSSIFVLIQII